MNELSPTARVKRKQILMAAGLLAAIFAIASIGVYMTGDAAPAQETASQSDIKTKSYIAPGEKVDPHDAWRGVADARLNTVDGRLQSLESENRTLKERLAEQRGPAKSAEQMSDKELDQRLAEYEASIDRQVSGYPPGTPSNPGARSPGPPSSSTTSAAAPDRERGTRSDAASPQATQPPTSTIQTVRLGRPVDGAKPATATPAPANARPEKTTRNYLPAGVFGQAVILSGLDAPTGGQAQSNPHPVILQLVEPAILPNRHRHDWDRCLVSAAGYGDLSSERAYFRLETLSCVSRSGKVLDVPLKGMIMGEDGKNGVRGRLVSKQGQVLANGLLAGAVSGIGIGLERSTQVQSVSALGSTTTIRPGDEFQAGIGAGVGRAMDRLANYYIGLAEKMFPVIEIDAQRVVTVALTQGANIDVDIDDE